MHPPIRRHGSACQEWIAIVRRHGQDGIGMPLQNLLRRAALQIVDHHLSRFRPRDNVTVVSKIRRNGIFGIRVVLGILVGACTLVAPRPVHGPQAQASHSDSLSSRGSRVE